MRKVVIFGFILLITIFIWPTNAEGEQEVFQVIPDDAIRLRILANSDNAEDQAIKELVRDEVSNQITLWVEHMTDIEEARQLIEKRIPQLEKLIATTLQNEDESFDIQYESNVTFPAKLYDSVVYPAGEYEAVLITIGKGEGTNWWCVLFPPLCFLDFGHGTTVADADEQVSHQTTEPKKEKGLKIKFFLFEWLGWT